MDRYVIRGGRAGADRLQVLGRNWAPTTSALFDRVGIAPGMRCLDLGCGAGDVTLELARRVGPGGSVVGMDMDSVKLDVVRKRASTAELDVLELVVADVYDFAETSSFDVVYCRFLLQHLTRPLDVLRAMWRATHPGGALIVEDADFEGSFCFPPDDAFDFWTDRYPRVLRSYGGDPTCGRKLAAMFVEAGTPLPEVGVVQCADVTGEAKLLPMLTVDATTEAMIEAQVATAAEIEAVLERLATLAADSSTLFGSPRNFQVWTRRPV